VVHEKTGTRHSKLNLFTCLCCFFRTPSQSPCGWTFSEICLPMARGSPTSVEQQIIQLQLRHFPQDQIVARLKTGKPRVSSCICEFRRTGIIPEALRIGRPCKSSSELTSFIEARTLQNPSRSEGFSGWEPGIHSLDRSRGPTIDQGLARDQPAREAAFKEMGDAIGMPVEEPMVSTASVPAPRSPTEY
jgi:hypothetical protein